MVVQADSGEGGMKGHERVNPWRWLRENFDRFVLDPDHIINSAVPFSFETLPPSGIYFWVEDGEITYVGVSVDMGYRFQQHRKVKGRLPERIYVIREMPEQFERDLLKEVEAFYLYLLMPKMNIKYPYPCEFVMERLEEMGIDWHNHVRAGYC